MPFRRLLILWFSQSVNQSNSRSLALSSCRFFFTSRFWFRPDVTVMADWALRTCYLFFSFFFSFFSSSVCCHRLRFDSGSRWSSVSFCRIKQTQTHTHTHTTPMSLRKDVGKIFSHAHFGLTRWHPEQTILHKWHPEQTILYPTAVIRGNWSWGVHTYITSHLDVEQLAMRVVSWWLPWANTAVALWSRRLRVCGGFSSRLPAVNISATCGRWKSLGIWTTLISTL